MTKGHWIPYSVEEREWLAEHGHLPRREIYELFCERFDRGDVTIDSIKAYCNRAGLKAASNGRFSKGQTPANKGKKMPFNANSARTQFKKGIVPHNTKFLGHERLSKEGYVEISVAQTNPHTGYHRRYVAKHRWLWEQQNGAIPKGFVLKCLDGNKLNTDPSNWKLISRSILPRLNGRHTGLNFDHAAQEVKPTMLSVAELQQKIRRAVGKGRRA